jgi:opacity protein-like surface antigen
MKHPGWRFFYLYLLIGCFSLAYSATSAAVEFEPNDESSSAQEINIGEAVSGNISSDSDADFFSFQIAEKVALEVSVSSQSRELDGFNFQILAEDETLLAGIVCRGTSCENGRLLSTGLLEGSYFLKITPENGRPSGGYFFTLNTKVEAADFVEFEPNDEPSSSQTVNYNFAYSGNISSDSDADFFSFQIAEKVALEVSVSSQSRELDGFNFQILAEDETLLAGIVCRGTSCENGRLLSTGLLEGSYFLKITPENGRPSGGYFFNIMLPDEDADSVADALDNCPNVPNSNQMDSDEDTVGDACDSDDDGDNTPDEIDAFPLDPTESSDSDEDGIGDNSDNCPLLANSDQMDTDGDAEGNECDLDDDNDGVVDQLEVQQGTDPLDRLSCEGCIAVLDIDANGQVEALSDGLIILRHLFGFNGESLIAGALGSNAQRTEPEAISAYLDSLGY